MSVVGKTCPFCQTPVKPGQEVITCENCGISHHTECWRENHGCTTYGCPGGAQISQIPHINYITQPTITPAETFFTRPEIYDTQTNSRSYRLPEVKKVSFVKKYPALLVIIVVIMFVGIGGAIEFHQMLVRSNVSYQNAQTDIATGDLESALTSLNAVSPYDTHYQIAQKQITAVTNAESIELLISDLSSGLPKYDSSMSAFWGDYNNGTDQLNYANSNYYYTDVGPYLDSAQNYTDYLETDASNVSQNVSNICTTIDMVSSNSLVNAFDTSTLVQDFNNSSEQAGTLAENENAEIDCLRNDNYMQCEDDIRINNEVFSKLQSDQANVDQQTQQLIVYMGGVVKNMLSDSAQYTNAGE